MMFRHMPDDALECPHCQGDSFDYQKSFPIDRAYLRVVKGRIKPVSGDKKIAVITVTCRSCHGEYLECDLLDEIAENES